MLMRQVMDALHKLIETLCSRYTLYFINSWLDQGLATCTSAFPVYCTSIECSQRRMPSLLPHRMRIHCVHDTTGALLWPRRSQPTFRCE